jgi:outer membrane protein assembly factor BamB
MLSGAREESELALVFPDPQCDRARIRAKQVLARIFQTAPYRRPGEVTPTLAALLEAYRKEHAAAEGTLAGRKGKYADLLQELASRKDTEGWSDPDWPTFGGDATRGRVLPAPEDVLDRLSRLCRRPTWRIDLASRSPREDPPLLSLRPAQWSRDLGCLPVLTGKHLLFADPDQVTAVNLQTGLVRDWHSTGRAGKAGTSPDSLRPRCTLTVAGDQVFVRMGEEIVSENRPLDPARKPRDSWVTCLELRPDSPERRTRWTIAANPQEHGTFEGSPLVHDGLLYVAATRPTADRATTAIHCYPANSLTTPAPRWITDVCESRDPAAPRALHYLLTLAGPYLVYCSHSGAVVALDPYTGQRIWAVRYPGQKRENRTALPGSEHTPPLHDIAPCIAAGGRVYGAPLDDERILCLDAASGRLLWQRERIQTVHLLGVGRERLIFTTPEGIRAVMADTGADEGGWMAPDHGRLAPAGRGLLLGDLVLWPTVRGVFALRQEDGRQADNPTLLHGIPPGNLLYAQGCLVSVERDRAHPDAGDGKADRSATTLTIFASGKAAVEAREREVGLAPTPRNWLELARARADAGDAPAARTSLDRAANLARALPRSLRESLLGEVQEERQHLTEQAIQAAITAGRHDEAERLLRQALKGETHAPLQARLLVRTARAFASAGEPNRAAGCWQTLLEEESLANATVYDHERQPHVARELAASITRKPDPKWAALREKLARPSAEGPLPPLALPLRRAWEVRLDPEEALLPDGEPSNPAREAFDPKDVEHAFVLSGGTGKDGKAGVLRCRSAVDGELRWTTALTFRPVWARTLGPLCLACGPGGVGAVRKEDGRSLWQITPATKLSGFRLAGGRLLVCEGGSRLRAFDPVTGGPLWTWAPPGNGILFPDYHAGPSTVLVQSPGRVRLLDAATGRVLKQTDGPDEPWPQAPLSLDPGSVAAVTDRETVECIDLRTGAVRWTWRPRGVSVLSGLPVAAIGSGESLFVAVPMNTGCRLEKLGPVYGKSAWEEPPVLRCPGADAVHWTADQRAVYAVEAGVLAARAAADARILWRQPLPDAGTAWQLASTGDVLLAWPATTPETAFRFRWLTATLEWNRSTTIPETNTPLLVFDAATGRPLQCLNLAGGPHARVALSAGRLTLAPRLTQEDRFGPAGVTVQRTASGLVVSAGSRLWGLH